MIAFDLVCQPREHIFEGWFASNQEFERQSNAGLVLCPFCDSANVTKALMAPNIGRKGNQRPTSTHVDSSVDSIAISNEPKLPKAMAETIAKLAKIQDNMLENSQWVGRQFAEEARAIHYGEQPNRIIHGEATMSEAEALHEEGVSVAPLPLPYVPPDAKN